MIDIFNPKISQVVKGLEGKMFLIYGDNRTGKTFNLAKSSKKVFYICFERGLNGISGVAHDFVSRWKDWRDIVKQLTDDATVKKARELYDTIVIDPIDRMGELCKDYIAASFGVPTVAAGNKGYGLWKEYEAEFNKWLHTLANAGYTLFFIGHQDSREMVRTNEQSKTEKYSKIYPYGDKRVVDPICNLVDYICYAQTVENNNYSTLFLSDSFAYKAGSRFKGLVDSIPEWSIEKLEKAVITAIESTENDGSKTITYEEKVKKDKESEVKEIPLKTLLADIKKLAMTVSNKSGNTQKYNEVAIEAFGDALMVIDGKLVKTADRTPFLLDECTERSREQLEIMHDELSRLAK